MEKDEISFQIPDNDASLLELENDTTDFVQTISRSISELQPDVDDVCDVMVFIEVLGYGEKDAVANGFRDLYDLAKHVFSFVDHYAVADQGIKERKTIETNPTGQTLLIKSRKRRLGEGIARASPWVASLIVLYVFGISLWMTFILPLPLVTALIAGVFTGIAISEGCAQLFGRLFSFYYEQGNMSQSETILRRMLRSQFLIILCSVGSIVAVGIAGGIPLLYLGVTCGSLVTISLTRIGSTVLYALKKLTTVVLSYIAALTSLVFFFFFATEAIASSPVRYFAALALGFGVLSLAPMYYYFKLGRRPGWKKTLSVRKGSDEPHFFKPPSINERTISSKFSVQLWEGAPYFWFGTLFFFVIFGDRIISWFANSKTAIFGGLIPVPLFNSTYSIGADLALFALFPVYIIAYVMMEPIYPDVLAMSVTHSVWELSRITKFFEQRYKQIMKLSMGASGIIAATLAIIGPSIIRRMGGGSTSVEIFFIALAGNILMAVFFVNSQFLMSVLNKSRILVILTSVCVSILVTGGFYTYHWGLEYIAFSYFLCVATGSIVSTVTVMKHLRNSGITFLAN
jgi:hypothetical protein